MQVVWQFHNTRLNCSRRIRFPVPATNASEKCRFQKSMRRRRISVVRATPLSLFPLFCGTVGSWCGEVFSDDTDDLIDMEVLKDFRP